MIMHLSFGTMKLCSYISCFLLPYLAESIIIQHFDPAPLSGFVTSPLTPNVIRNVDIQFRRGAFADYMPTVRLDLDSTRFLGASPEEVRIALDGEDKKNSFIILDGRTAADGSVWWVDRYADDMFEGEPEELEHFIKYDCANVKDGERVLLKSRRKIVDVPTFFDFLEDGVTDIFGHLPEPYDPHNSTVPAMSIYDWDTEPPDPPTPFIFAAPNEFMTTTDPAITHKFVIPSHIPPHHRFPDRCVRLKAYIARQQGLLSRWTVVSQPYEGSDSPEGSIVLQQEWDTSRPRPGDVQKRVKL